MGTVIQPICPELENKFHHERKESALKDRKIGKLEATIQHKEQQQRAQTRVLLDLNSSQGGSNAINESVLGRNSQQHPREPTQRISSRLNPIANQVEELQQQLHQRDADCLRMQREITRLRSELEKR